MKFRNLGRTGVQVSQLCLGTMSFGSDADSGEAGKMYQAARECGVNFVDTANSYNKGESEKMVGSLLAGHREEVVLATKIFNQMGADRNARGGSRRNISLAIDASLKRLNTDWIDVLFMHRFDNNTPLEETLRGLEDAVRAGKILYPAASNYSAWQVSTALGIAEREGWSRFEVIQPMYNLVKRQVESEILPMAAFEDLGVVTYSPVGGGLLSGKYGATARPNHGRLVDNAMYGRRYSDEWGFRTAEAFTQLAREHSVNAVSLAVAWAGAHPQVTAPIVGARSAEQLKASLDSVNIEMTAELRAAISALSPEPAPATDRLEERR